MGILRLFRVPRRAVLRVSAEHEPATFDALLVFGGRRWRRSRDVPALSLTGERTPFSLDLPDRDVTVVVQPRDRARRVVAEYEREIGGRRALWGLSRFATPVLQRRGGGILCAGLPAGDDDEEGGRASVVAPTT